MFSSHFCYTLIFIYKQLWSDLSSRNCLYSQGFLGSNLSARNTVISWFKIGITISDFKIFSKMFSIATWGYTYAYFFGILSPVKMKLGQILVCQIFITCFWLNAADWKLVPGPFMILLKWQNNELWPFLIVDIYHWLTLIVSYSHFQKNETLESWLSWLLSNLNKLLNWKGSGT